ncbi:MAG: hypothetical protein JWO56_232 [Acidobacteria bacterium]|nr:hypothetical protein [Acidobacteriota bacterium]
MWRRPELVLLLSVVLVVVSVWSLDELVMLVVVRDEVVPLFMVPLFIVPSFMVPELFIDELLFVVVPVPLFMPLMDAVLSVAPLAEVPLVPLTLVVFVPAVLKLLPLFIVPLVLPLVVPLVVDGIVLLSHVEFGGLSAVVPVVFDVVVVVLVVVEVVLL